MSTAALLDMTSPGFPDFPALGPAWTVDDTVRLLAVGREGYDLTPEQRDAVGAPLTPGLLIAGAGSGKTEVMAARVLHLVATGQVLPDEVLGLTFTVKATASLSDRVRSVLDRLRGCRQPEPPGGGPPPPLDQHDQLDQLDGEPTISTYNGYGARLVADHGLWIGIEPGVRLATEGLRWQLALRVVRTWAGRLDVDVQPASVAERLRRICDELADHLATPVRVREAHRALRDWVVANEKPRAARLGKVSEALQAMDIREQLLDLADAYEQAKRERSLLDHGDQIALAARLAERPAVRDAERRQFRVVLLDEYQDTNVAQRVLLQRLFAEGHPVTAVGDPAQSIYAFRGASVSNIVRFPEHFRRADGGPADVFPLSTNFRSGGAILDAANRVSCELDRVGSVKPPVLVPRPGRETGGEDGGSVHVGMLPDVEQEAEWVADRLLDAARDRRAEHRQSCPQPDCEGWHQVAVLCRKRSQFGLIRDALEQRDVPVEVVGLGGLLDAPEVADLVSVLRVLHDPTSNAAMIRLLTGPRWRIGPRDLDALGRRARALLRRTPGGRPGAPAAAGGPVNELALAVLTDDAEVGALADAVERLEEPDLDAAAPLSPEARRRLAALQADLSGLRDRMGQPLPDLVADVERTLGLDIELESTPHAVGRGRRANILAFSEVAANFVGIDGETHLGAFLASLDAAEQAEDGYDLGTPSPADTLKLLTVHAAKGLEWDVVAVPGLSGGKQNSVFPSGKPGALWPWRSERLPRDVRGDRDDQPRWREPTTPGIAAFKEENKARELQEERRLAYVALTRARDVLFCSGYWWGATAKSPQLPVSPFFAAVEQACLDGAGVAEPRPPEPVVGEDENPLLAEERQRDVSWPSPPQVPEGVLEAAAAVRAARRSDRSAVEGDLDGADRLRLDQWRRDAELLLRERAGTTGVPLVPLPDGLAVSDLVELGDRPESLAQRLHRPLPRPPAPAARRGTVFHSWVEQRFARRSLLGPDDLPGAGDVDGTADAPESEDELTQLQQAFLTSSWAEREPVAVEVPFELVLGSHLVRGRIDAVYARPDGGYDVIDYKTGLRPRGRAARAAAVQLSCYRLAWCDLTGADPADVGAAFLYVREGDAGLVRPALDDRAALEALVDSLPTAGEEG